MCKCIRFAHTITPLPGVRPYQDDCTTDHVFNSSFEQPLTNPCILVYYSLNETTERYWMEIDEHYCDVIRERWQKFTGKKAELVNGN